MVLGIHHFKNPHMGTVLFSTHPARETSWERLPTLDPSTTLPNRRPVGPSAADLFARPAPPPPPPPPPLRDKHSEAHHIQKLGFRKHDCSIGALCRKCRPSNILYPHMFFILIHHS